MTTHTDDPAPETPETADRVVSAERLVAAEPAAIFELIADPAQQPRWDGNDNLQASAPGQRVHAVGDVFVTTLTNGADRENRIVEFEEGARIAWLPSPVGEEAPGHLWRWEVFVDDTEPGRARVVHTYDWSDLHDPARQVRARATTPEKLAASVDRLAELAENAS